MRPDTPSEKSLIVYAITRPGGEELSLSVADDSSLRDVLQDAKARLGLFDSSCATSSLKLWRRGSDQPLKLDQIAKDVLRPDDRLLVAAELPAFTVDAWVWTGEPGEIRAGELHIRFGLAAEGRCDLPPRLMKMIIRLQAKLDADCKKMVPASMRGFIHDTTLASVYDGHPQVVMDNYTIVRYRSLVRKALQRLDPTAVALIEHRRGYGTRLTVPVTIHFI